LERLDGSGLETPQARIANGAVVLAMRLGEQRGGVRSNRLSMPGLGTMPSGKAYGCRCDKS